MLSSVVPMEEGKEEGEVMPQEEGEGGQALPPSLPHPFKEKGEVLEEGGTEVWREVNPVGRVC
jgi:hypothetical protein